MSDKTAQGVAEVSKTYAWDTAALYAKLYHEAKARVAELERDAARIDWLEAQINENGALHLHDGNDAYGLGLGLQTGRSIRSLRKAIDDASKEAK